VGGEMTGTELLEYVLTFIVGVLAFSFCSEMIIKIPQEKKIFEDGMSSFKKPSAKSIVVQVLGGIMAVILVAFYGMGPEAVTVLVFWGILVTITFIDAATMEIPFFLNVAIFVLGVISIFTRGGFVLSGDNLSLVSRLIGMLCISLPMFIIILIVPDGFGGGDIKLMFAAGFFLGWKATLIGFFFGLLIGGTQGVILLIRRRKGRKDHFALGPALAVGLMISTLWGDAIMESYLNMMKIAFYA
jgi:leader peptidase (prepilin peptidase)/N-methyltransferase